MKSRFISILLVLLIFSGQVHEHGVSFHIAKDLCAIDTSNSDGWDFNLMAEVELDEEDESSEKSLSKCYLPSGIILTEYFFKPTGQTFGHFSKGLNSKEIFISCRNLRL